MKPLIGITPDTHDGTKLKTRTKREKFVCLWDSYLKATLDHGAIAVVLPVTNDKKIIRSMLGRLDGVVLAGGDFDIPPHYYGEKPSPFLGNIKQERSEFEILLLKEAARQNIPLLGICGGMQAINVAFGGSLYQDIRHQKPDAIQHEQKIRKDRTSHRITVFGNTLLQHAMTSRKRKASNACSVNSTHHQAVRKVAKGFSVSAVSSDQIVEAIESDTHTFILGVQWHPELLYQRQQNQASLLRFFIRAAAKHRAANHSIVP